jgi:hypothetical protein
MAKATGLCKHCHKPIPKDADNQFYHEPCRRIAWRKNHPDELEPDWDLIQALALLGLYPRQTIDR